MANVGEPIFGILGNIIIAESAPVDGHSSACPETFSTRVSERDVQLLVLENRILPLNLISRLGLGLLKMELKLECILLAGEFEDVVVNVESKSEWRLHCEIYYLANISNT